MAWDVMSRVTKMAWDVMSGVTKTAWEVLSGVANLCGMFWSWSLRSSEDIGKQYSIAIVYGINNTSSKVIKIQNNEFSDRPRKCTFCSSQ